jgi:hypothetical protein
VLCRRTLSWSYTWHPYDLRRVSYFLSFKRPGTRRSSSRLGSANLVSLILGMGDMLSPGIILDFLSDDDGNLAL